VFQEIRRCLIGGAFWQVTGSGHVRAVVEFVMGCCRGCIMGRCQGCYGPVSGWFMSDGPPALSWFVLTPLSPMSSPRNFNNYDNYILLNHNNNTIDVCAKTQLLSDLFVGFMSHETWRFQTNSAARGFTHIFSITILLII